jgi:hypothetical protein
VGPGLQPGLFQHNQTTTASKPVKQLFLMLEIFHLPQPLQSLVPSFVRPPKILLPILGKHPIPAFNFLNHHGLQVAPASRRHPTTDNATKSGKTNAELEVKSEAEIAEPAPRM